MHTYKILTDADELEACLLPVFRANGSEIPAKGCYVAAVEFDDAGEVVAYQLAQNAVFLEGLWARDRSAHLLSLHRMIMWHLESLGIFNTLTMTRQDDTGERIGKIAQALGYAKQNWNVFRRKA